MPPSNGVQTQIRMPRTTYAARPTPPSAGLWDVPPGRLFADDAALDVLDYLGKNGWVTGADYVIDAAFRDAET